MLLWRARSLQGIKGAGILEGCQIKMKKLSSFQVVMKARAGSIRIRCCDFSSLVSENAADTKYLTQRFSVLGELRLTHMHMKEEEEDRDRWIDRVKKRDTGMENSWQ